MLRKNIMIIKNNVAHKWAMPNILYCVIIFCIIIMLLVLLQTA